jgi:cobalt-zinc-cadmium efflux system protein
LNLAEIQALRRKDRRYLLLACGLSTLILTVEVVGGLWTGSLALLADAGHVLTDLLALLLALTAVLFASRPASSRRTWGYHRLEILSALVNGFLLLGIAGVILWEAWERLAAPRPVQSGGMVAVAAVGLVANLLGVWLLSSASGSLNIRGVLWHLVGDTISSVGVIVAGLLIAVTGVVRIDAVVSVLIAGIVVYGAVRVVREAYDVLLESAPAGLDCDEVADAIRSLDGVLDVHDLHIWSITTGMPALSGHVVVPPSGPPETDTLLKRIKVMLKSRFEIDHATIQVESRCFEMSGDLHG